MGAEATIDTAARARVSVRRHSLTHRIMVAVRVFLIYVLLMIIAAGTSIPLLWMVASSFKTTGDIFVFPPRWIPDPVVWTNFGDVMASMPFGIMTFNTFKIAILNVVGATLSCALAAYCFARLRFPGRDALFVVLLASMMVPSQVTLIPVFLVMRQLGWIDTHQPLWVPGLTGGAFGTFLLRQFFLTLPSELEDAARIDGASTFGILWRIFIPLSRPALATLAIFVFLFRWNDLLGPVIYLTTPEKMTLPIGLAFFRGQYQTEWALMMAGALMSLIPVLVLYAAFQRYFVQGVVLSGIKG